MISALKTPVLVYPEFYEHLLTQKHSDAQSAQNYLAMTWFQNAVDSGTTERGTDPCAVENTSVTTVGSRHLQIPNCRGNIHILVLGSHVAGPQVHDILSCYSCLWDGKHISLGLVRDTDSLKILQEKGTGVYMNVGGAEGARF